ncbi:gliding motility-associated lipoprotein GldH [compost metagenome]
MDPLKNRKASSFIFLLIFLCHGCIPDTLVDYNTSVPDNHWLYSKSAKVTFDVKDTQNTYDISFKIRNTNDYRYANLYVLMHLKGPSFSKNLRHQLLLARTSGQWTGKGSGDLFSNSFLLLKHFRFPKAGIYTLEVEQNMRDNPLYGVSDIGLLIEKSKKP